jgi:hypothetical protein
MPAARSADSLAGLCPNLPLGPVGSALSTGIAGMGPKQHPDIIDAAPLRDRLTEAAYAPVPIELENGEG